MCLKSISINVCVLSWFGFGPYNQDTIKYLSQLCPLKRPRNANPTSHKHLQCPDYGFQVPFPKCWKSSLETKADSRTGERDTQNELIYLLILDNEKTIKDVVLAGQLSQLEHHPPDTPRLLVQPPVRAHTRANQ